MSIFKKKSDNIYDTITHLYKDSDPSIDEFKQEFADKHIQNIIIDWFYGLFSRKTKEYTINIFINKG